MKQLIFLCLVALASIAGTGCASSYYGRYEQEEEAIDTLLPPPMTTNDVIALAKDSISDEVIISQMRATDSYFRLTAEDIIALKKAGVSDTVVNAMIKTAETATPRKARRYYGYPFTYWYPYYFYGYPWYSSLYFGLRGGHYYHLPSVSSFPAYRNSHTRSYFSGHGSRGHSSGGHRSFGRHR